jgi:PKHD-type hydroxylase
MNSRGYYIAPPGRTHFNSHFQYSGSNRMLSGPECDAVLALAEKRGFGKAAVGNPDSARLDEKYRCAKVASLEHTDDTDWLYERINLRVQGANDHFQFHLTGLMEAFQVVRYDAPAIEEQEAGHYDWHQDFGGDYMSRRKLSVVVQLSAPADYEGCNLTIMDPGPKELTGIYQERGAGVIFPSWTPHCVTPITRGVRYALVAWVHGFPFQ